MYEHKSKYSIVEKPKSFIIHSDRNDRIDVEVELTNNYKFKVSSVKGGNNKWNWLNNTEFDMFDYGDMMDRISRIIMFNWEKPDNKDKHHWFGLYNWVKQQNSKALNDRVHKQWKRLLDTLDDKIVEAHKKCYHYLFRQPDFLENDTFYNHEQLVHDLIDYRACAVVLQERKHLGKKFIVESDKYQKEINNILKRNMRNDPNGKYSTTSLLDQFWNELSDSEKFRMIKESWRAFLSDTSKVYDNLNKTIENMPGNLSADTISNLSQVHLKRPITNRLEFITALSPYGQKKSNYSADLNEPKKDMLMFAKEKEIKKAIDIYNSCVGNIDDNYYLAHLDKKKIGYGKTTEVRRFVKFILSKGGNFDGGIVSATQRAKDKILLEKI